MKEYLFKQRRIEPLVFFRICFGFLLAAEGFGAIATGWVKRVMIDPVFTFSFIGFEWLQPLDGNGMYIYFAVMGFAGLMVMLGSYYRFAMTSFAILWTSSYLMQKSSYNNHYYLLCVLSWLMVFVPAHHAFSLDTHWKRVQKVNTYSNWVWVLLVGLLWLVYTYASINKLQADWVSGAPVDIFLRRLKAFHFPDFLSQIALFEYIEKGIQAIFNYKPTLLGFSYGGILFDLLVVPAFFWKPTRKFAVLVSFFFHLFNSFVLQIGIFPYLMLSFLIFFFPYCVAKKWLQRIGYRASLGWKNLKVSEQKIRFTSYFIPIFFIINLLLPLRHHLLPSNVNWSEEGHRLSWRMMLRAKSGNALFYTKTADEPTKKRYFLDTILTRKQRISMSTRPDMIWQTAQWIKKDLTKKGQSDIEVYANVNVGLNGRPKRKFINSDVNLANEKWNYWCTHHDWVLPYPYDMEEEEEEYDD